MTQCKVSISGLLPPSAVTLTTLWQKERQLFSPSVWQSIEDMRTVVGGQTAACSWKKAVCHHWVSWCSCHNPQQERFNSAFYKISLAELGFCTL